MFVFFFQGKSDHALEQHLVDLRAQNAELSSENFSGSNRMQSALIAALRLASLLSTSQTQDTIQQAMAVLDSVNKKLYGMIDHAGQETTSQSEPRGSGEVQASTVSQSLANVRGYGDDDDEDSQYPARGALSHQQTSAKRASPPSGPSGLSASSQQRPGTGPAKRFRFGL